MKILITGIAGYIGSNCAAYLSQAGHKIYGVDNFNSYYSPDIKRENAKMLQSRFDIPTTRLNLAAESAIPLIEGMQAIVHFAAQPGISSTTSWQEYVQNNIFATHKLVESCRATQIEQFVNISTSSVYGLHATASEDAAPNPASHYGVTKLAAEQEVMAANRIHGFPACSLRPFSVYGERERPDKLFSRLVKSVAEDLPFPLYEGAEAHKRSFTYVGDLCESIRLVLEKPDLANGQIFNIGMDKCSSTMDAIKAVEDAMGQKVKIECLPPRQGDQTTTLANIEKARRILDWTPRTTLEDGAKKVAEWYLNEIRGKLDWV